MGMSHQNAEGAGAWACRLGGHERWHRQKETLINAKGAPLWLFGAKAASLEENPAKVRNMGSEEGGGGSTGLRGRWPVLTTPLIRPVALGQPPASLRLLVWGLGDMLSSYEWKC